jgi:hypothetical protein
MSHINEEVIRACGRKQAYGLQIGAAVAEKVLAEATDPKHGVERLVRLGDVLQLLRDDAAGLEQKVRSDMGKMIPATMYDAADNIERGFTGVTSDHEYSAHRPVRGDDVEAWIKRMRDNYNANQGHAPSDYSYRALDRLLDRYRECSDCGLTLLVEDDERGEP